MELQGVIMTETPGVNHSEEQVVSPLSVILPIHESTNSIVPFVHALKLAYASKGELEIVDVRSEEEAIEHIGVREILEKWGVLPLSSSRSDVAKTGLRIKKIVKEGNKRGEIVKRLKRHAHDLLVIGTVNQSAIGTLFGRNLAEYLADYFRHTTLFLPSGARSFIDENTGNTTLQTILIPVENTAYLVHAFEVLKRILSLFPGVEPSIIGIHVGSRFPDIPADCTTSFEWKTELYSQGVVSSVLKAAQKYGADLIVMATNGRDSFSQKLVGSNTEKVLRSSPCPVLSVSVQ